MDTSDTTLTTIERALDVLHSVHEMNGARAPELVSELDVARSTLYKYLATLQQEGYVVKEGDEYHISLEFLRLGIQARNRHEGYRYGTEKVREIAEETGERAQLVVEENGRGIYLHTEALGSTAVETDRRVGTSRYLHSSAAGKAILAHLPAERVDEIIDTHGLPAETENTITERTVLRDELDQVRETGVAFNDEESIEGLRAVGAPIKPTDGGRVLGALSVSGPSNRFEASLYREEIPDLLLGYTNEIELKIRYA